MYRIAICDDDEKEREVFEKLIKDTQMLEESHMCIRHFFSGEEILACQNFQFDLVIMDIQMRQINGYEAAMKLRERDHYFLLVFCSGIISPTPDFFRANVFRYFDKNESEAVLLKDMKAVINEMIKRKSRISITCKDSSKEEVRVFADEILYVEIISKGCRIFTNDSEGFVRVHKSYLVNMAYVQRASSQEVVLTNEKRIAISRSRKKHFEDMFMNFFFKKY